MRYILLLLILFSCKEDIEKPRIDRYQQTLESCRESIFIGEISSHSNFLNLMRCLKWNQELPTLYSEISKINPNDWNFLTSAIDSEFFVRDAANQRNKLFSFIYQSNRNGRLKKIDQYLKVMSIKNLSVVLKLFFKCDGNCSNKLYYKLIPQGENVVEAIDGTLEFFSSLENNGESFDFYLALKDLINDKSTHYLIENSSRNLIKVIEHPFYQNYLENRIVQFLKISKDNQGPIIDFLNTFKDHNDFATFFDEYHSNLIEAYPLISLLGKNKGQISCDEKLKLRMNKKIFDLIKFVNDENFQNLPEYLLNDFSLLALGGQTCKKLFFEKEKYSHNLFIKDGYRRVELTPEKDIKSIPISLGSILNYSNIFNMGKSFVGNDLPSENMIGSAIDFSTNEMLSDTIHYLDYLRKENKSNYENLLVALHHLRPANIKTLGKLMGYLQDNPSVKKHVIYLLNNLSQKEISSLMIELNKVMASFDDPVELFKFLSDGAHLAQNVLNRLKINVKTDPRSVDKIQSLFDEFIQSAEKENFQREFAKVLSSKYIIKAARLIGRGVVDSNPATALVFQTNLDFVFEKLNNTGGYYKVGLKPGSEYECLRNLTEGTHFVDILGKINRKCADLLIKENVFGLLQDISVSNDTYEGVISDRFGKQPNVFDEKGILGTPVLQSGLIFSKKIGLAAGIDGPTLIEKFFEKLKFYSRFEKSVVVQLLDDAITLLSKLMNQKGFESFRNSALSGTLEFLPENGDQFLKNIKAVVSDLESYESEKDFIDRSKFSCDNFFKEEVGHERCLEKKEVKKGIKNIIHFLTRENEKGRPSALSLITEALSPDVKYEINFYDDLIRYQLSIGETLDFLSTVYDPDYKVEGEFVNRKDIEFNFYENGKKRKEVFELTTGDRLEAVVREVRFDGNYLGAHYMNSVASNPYYVEIIQKKYSLLKTCGIYLRFCLRTFTKIEYAMLQNGVANYPSLWETETFFGFGKYIKTLLHTLVDSSSSKAAKASIVKFGKFDMPYMQSQKELKEHNGRVLSEITYLSVFSNLYRVLIRSFGNVENLRKYRSSDRLKFINNNAFSKVEPKYFENLIENILKNIQSHNGETIDTAVDLISDLDDYYVKKLESVIHNLLYLISYLPSVDDVNGLKTILDFIDDLVAQKNITKYILKKNVFEALLQTLEPMLDFMVHGLEGENTSIYQGFLMNVSEFITKMNSLSDLHFSLSLGEFLDKELFKNEEQRNTFESFTLSIGKASRSLINDKSFFEQLIKDAKFLTSAEDTKFNEFYRDFFTSIYNTVKEENCLNEICEDNKNYDEAFHFIYFLTVENDGNSNFLHLINYLNGEKLKAVGEEFGKLMDSVEVIE